MPKYKTQTNDLTEVIESGSGGSGGLTYETVNLGNIDASTGTFDTVPEASKEKIINIFKNKKFINLKIKVNDIFLFGSPVLICQGNTYACMLFNLDKIALTINGASALDLMISLDLTLDQLIVANTNYILELGYDN